MADGAREWLDQTQTLAKLWMETLSRMTGAALAFSPGSTPPEAARQVRDAFLSSMDHSIESYMRSEPFLQSMKQALDVAMETRKQFSQIMNQVHHSVGTVAEEDARSLMLGIRHAEERFGRRMDQLNARLDAIDRRLDELQNHVGSAAAGSPPDRPEKGEASESKPKSAGGSVPAGQGKPGRKSKKRGGQK